AKPTAAASSAPVAAAPILIFPPLETAGAAATGALVAAAVGFAALDAGVGGAAGAAGAAGAWVAAGAAAGWEQAASNGSARRPIPPRSIARRVVHRLPCEIRMFPTFSGAMTIPLSTLTCSQASRRRYASQPP